MDNIEEAIKLLRDNDYIVIKWTKAMETASANCDGASYVDCDSCPCSRCLAGCED